MPEKPETELLKQIAATQAEHTTLLKQIASNTAQHAASVMRTEQAANTARKKIRPGRPGAR